MSDHERCDNPGGEVSSGFVDHGCDTFPDIRVALVQVLQNAVIEKSVWETQNVVRSLDAYAEWVYSTTSDPGSAILAWTLEIAGRMVSRSRSGVPDEGTARPISW